jgi:hypothetical protein
MAYKVFSNGSVLNASDLNDYLMNQSVVVFSSSAARASAITSPLEGMLTWLQDTNKYQYYSGSDWVDLIEAASATGFVKIVQTVKTNVFTASVGIGSQSGDVTGLTVSITPSSASSKIRVQGAISIATNPAVATYLTVYRDGSVISNYYADAASARQRSSAASFNGDRTAATIPIDFLDSPATTSAVVYSVRLGHHHDSTATVLVNRGYLDTDNNTFARTASTISATEIIGS